MLKNKFKKTRPPHTHKQETDEKQLKLLILSRKIKELQDELETSASSTYILF